MTTPTPQEPDGLGFVLKQTEAELAEKLEEACAAENREVSKESTDELARLSDELLAAARAAKDLVSLRKRRHDQPPTGLDTTKGAIREFTDREGKAWRVWAVTPGQVRTSKREASLGEFEQGWLAFETLDEEARKRLPHYPADWFSMSETKLRDLLGLAVEAPTRRTEFKRPDSRSEPPL